LINLGNTGSIGKWETNQEKLGKEKKPVPLAQGGTLQEKGNLLLRGTRGKRGRHPLSPGQWDNFTLKRKKQLKKLVNR